MEEPEKGKYIYLCCFWDLASKREYVSAFDNAEAAIEMQCGVQERGKADCCLAKAEVLSDAQEALEELDNGQ